MIKKGIELNPNVKSSKEQSELTVNQRLLKKALEKRKELAQAYKRIWHQSAVAHSVA